MDLQEYLSTVRRRWALVVACVLAALAVGVVVTSLATPQYASSARLFVSTAERGSTAAYEGSLLSAERMASYADLAKDPELSRRVVDNLGLEMSPGTLAGKITATVRPETVILDVGVIDPDPEEAQRLTQAVADELVVFISELEKPTGRADAPIKVTVVGPASRPQIPVAPQPLINLGVAGILGLVLGVGAAVCREQLDTTVRSRHDVTGATGAPVIGTIPYDPAAGRAPLVTALGPNAPRSEAFRVLRTNLQFVDMDGRGKAFVVTSSVPDEGKTTTAVNVAITLAQAGHRVLLVDADLRDPGVPAYLQLDGADGLAMVLAGQTRLRDAIQAYLPVDNLSVLTGGAVPPNPSELLQSQAMVDVLAEARATYDVVIVDVPPLLTVTDAALVAARCDGTLLVARHGKTTLEQLGRSMEQLATVGGRVLGVVLARVPNRRWMLGRDGEYGNATRRTEQDQDHVMESSRSGASDYPRD